MLSTEEIQAVLADLQSNESRYYPLFLLWLSSGLRNAEIRGLTWDCIRWEECEVLVTFMEHQQQMEQLRIYDPYGLVFVAPSSYGNVYDHLVGRVWHRSLQRCGLKPRRLYAQLHSFLSHALAMGNSPADLAAAAGHSIKMLLDTYAKPTGRLKIPTWATAEAEKQKKMLRANL